MDAEDSDFEYRVNLSKKEWRKRQNAIRFVFILIFLSVKLFAFWRLRILRKQRESRILTPLQEKIVGEILKDLEYQKAHLKVIINALDTNGKNTWWQRKMLKQMNKGEKRIKVNYYNAISILLQFFEKWIRDLNENMLQKLNNASF